MPFPRFREDIRNEIILSRLREREVDNRIVVTDSEIDKLHQHAAGARPGAASEYNLSHILVTVPENASPEQIQARRGRAEQALEQIEDGRRLPPGRGERFPTRPTRCRAAPWAGAMRTRLPTLFLDALENPAAGRGEPPPAQRQRLPYPAG